MRRSILRVTTFLIAVTGWSTASHALEDPAVYLATFGSLGTGPGQFALPHGLCADRAGHLYVADAGNHRITELTYDGAFVRQWGSHGSGPGQFSTPWNVLVSHDGFVYVSERDNNRVQKFTADGQFVSILGAPGQFGAPYGLVEDAVGNLYVSDSVYGPAGRVQVFTAEGNFIKYTNVGSDPYGLAFDGTDLYLIIQGFVARSHVLAGGFVFGTLFGVTRGPCCPTGIAFDSHGNMVIADTNANRIRKFTTSGTLLADWKTFPMGTLTGSLNTPLGVSFDTDGNFYVSDGINRRVLKFSGTQTLPVPTAPTTWGRVKSIYR